MPVSYPTAQGRPPRIPLGLFPEVPGDGSYALIALTLGLRALFTLFTLSSSFLPRHLQPGSEALAKAGVAGVCVGVVVSISCHVTFRAEPRRMPVSGCVLPADIRPERGCLASFSGARGDFSETALFAFAVFFCFSLYPRRFWYKLQGRYKPRSTPGNSRAIVLKLSLCFSPRSQLPSWNSFFFFYDDLQTTG